MGLFPLWRITPKPAQTIKHLWMWMAAKPSQHLKSPSVAVIAVVMAKRAIRKDTVWEIPVSYIPHDRYMGTILTGKKKKKSQL